MMHMIFGKTIYFPESSLQEKEEQIVSNPASPSIIPRVIPHFQYFMMYDTTGKFQLEFWPQRVSLVGENQASSQSKLLN